MVSKKLEKELITNNLNELETNIVISNLSLNEETFFYNLREKGSLDIGLYNQFVFLLIELHKTIDDNHVRCNLSNNVWELFFLISQCIINHQNPSDIYVIINVDEKIVYKVVNDLYEIGNFISWNKELDFKNYLLE